MPNEGQQVYGAQHPPSLKLIKELNPVGSSMANSSSNSASNSVSANSNTSFKTFEKQTSEAWDFDDSLTDFDYSLPISILDSESVAQKVIRSHQEAQKRLSNSFTASNYYDKPSSKPGMNGPGKALRQSDFRQGQKSHQEINKFNSASNPSSHHDNLSSHNKLSNTNLSSSGGSLTTSTTTNTTTATNSMSTTKTTTSKTDLNVAAGSLSALSIGEKKDSNNSRTGFAYASTRDTDENESKLEKFRSILSKNPINLEDLQKASWKGIPKTFRPICWKLLSDYLPLKCELQEKTIEQKRQAYWESVSEHYSSIYIDSHHEMLRQILNDIPRMNPLIPIFQKQVVQEIFQRVLYVWAVRHPGSGYVQGINDLLTPFFTVFLTEYTDKNVDLQTVEIEKLPIEQLKNLEADSYWCMSKLLDRIQENYVFCQPGIQNNVKALENLIKRIDIQLHAHLKNNNIDFIQFAFRWMNNLLMREIPLSCTIRLWDTYHAEPFGFSDFHLYVCAAFLVRYSKDLLKETDFQGLMLLLQNLPTKNMKANDIDLLTAEAYKLQVMFANSPNHTAAVN